MKIIGSIAALALFAAPLASADEAAVTLLPTPGETMPKEGNVAWCPTFQLAWDRLREVLGGRVALEPKSPVADRLNAFRWDKGKVLPPGSYYSNAGLRSAGVVENGMAAIRRQFGDDARALRLPALSGDGDGYYAMAALIHRMRFQRRLYRSKSRGMKFESRGKVTNVAFFGTAGAASGNVSVDIAHYGHSKPDEYTLYIRARGDEKMVLSRMPKPENLATGLRQVRGQLEKKRVVQQTLHQGKKIQFSPYLEAGDTLKIPYLNLSRTTRFSEIEGRRVIAPDGKNGTLATAFQFLSVEINERGAVVRSIASVDDPFGPPPSPPPSIPRDFVFDVPFLLCLWRDGADWPYLAMWVGDTGLMERFEKR